MEISSRKNGSVALLDIAGEIDLYNETQMNESIRELFDEGCFKIVLNFDRVSYIDSAVIELLITWHEKLQKEGGGMRLMHVSGSVKKIFKIAKLDAFFEISDSEEDALENFT